MTKKGPNARVGDRDRSWLGVCRVIDVSSMSRGRREARVRAQGSRRPASSAHGPGDCDARRAVVRAGRRALRRGTADDLSSPQDSRRRGCPGHSPRRSTWIRVRESRTARRDRRVVARAAHHEASWRFDASRVEASDSRANATNAMNVERADEYVARGSTPKPPEPVADPKPPCPDASGHFPQEPAASAGGCRSGSNRELAWQRIVSHAGSVRRCR